MEQIKRYLNSSIGKKVLMALTGLAMIGFLVGHVSGNLLIFVGKQTFNNYSHALISNPLIYAAEAFLILILLGHLISAIILQIKKKDARPFDYNTKKSAGHTSRKTISSTTMIFSGIVVLIFIPLHIWTFKFGAFYPSDVNHKVRDLHRLVIEEFQKNGMVVWYVFAMIVIGFHLWHGFGSAFESLGVGYKKILKRFGQLLALAISAGFIIIPVAIKFKFFGDL